MYSKSHTYQLRLTKDQIFEIFFLRLRNIGKNLLVNKTVIPYHLKLQVILLYVMRILGNPLHSSECN